VIKLIVTSNKIENIRRIIVFRKVSTDIDEELINSDLWM